MARWTVVLAALVGCMADDPREGVQVGEEFGTDEDPCEITTRELGLDEPVFSDGSSVGELLASMPLVGVGSPSWNDGGSATISVDLAWAGTAITWFEFTPIDGATCPGPSARLELAGRVTSSDGLVDEHVSAEVVLAEDGGGSIDEWIPAEEVEGTIDVVALLDPQIDGDFTADLEVLVHLSPGEDTHGALVAIGCPVGGGGGTSTRSATSTDTATTPPTEPCLPVEHDVASW